MASATWPGLQHARPDQGHGHHPGPRRRRRLRRRPAFRRPSSPSICRARRHRREDRPTLFFIMFTIGITKGRWNTLVTELQQFKDDYDKNQPLWKVLPEFVAKHPRYERGRPPRPVPPDPRGLQGQRRRPPDHRDVPSDMVPAMKPGGRLRQDGAPRDRARVAHRRAGRPRHQRAADALSAGHPAADPGERFNATIVRYLQFAASSTRSFPGLRDRHPRPAVGEAGLGGRVGAADHEGNLAHAPRRSRPRAADHDHLAPAPRSPACGSPRC